MAATSARLPHPFASPASGPSRDGRARTQTQMSSSSSQMLPSITCSSCGVSTQMDDLGSHICQPAAAGGSASNSRSAARPSSTVQSSRQVSPHDYRSTDERRDQRPQPSQPPPQHYQQPPQRPPHPQQPLHRHQREPSTSERRGASSLKLDMSQLRPPDTSGFLAAGDAGMAGVGRRGFGSPTTPVHVHPFGTSPQTPPSAAMATPPVAASMGKQNQSQPYLIASHANFNRQGDDAGSERGGERLQVQGHGHGQGTGGSGSTGNGNGNGGRGGSFLPAGYRERGPSPMLGNTEWTSAAKNQNQNPGRTANSREYARPQMQGSSSSSRSGIPIQLDIKPQETSGTGGVPDTKNLHSPAFVPQTATSGSSSFGLSRDRDRNGDRETVKSAVISPAGNGSIMTTMTSLKTGISGGGASHPRPEVTPSEWNRKMEAAGVSELVGGTSVTRSRSRSSANTNRSAGTGSTTKQANQREPPSTRSSIEERAQAPRSLRVTNGSPDLDRDETANSRWGALRNVVQTAATLATSRKASNDQNTSFLDVPSTSSNHAVRPEQARSNSASASDAVSSTASSDGTNQSGSAAKLPFFERYKKMAESTNGATSMVRQISISRPGQLASTRPNPALDAVGEESNILTESPTRFGFNEREDDSSLPWLRRASEASSRQEPFPTQPFSDASLSSNGSTSESKARHGDLAIITPSASMNQLDGIAMGARGRHQPPLRVREASGEDGELIEGLIEDLKTDLDRLGMLSPNMSVDRRTERESYQSSLLAPSDSISMPGLDLQRRKSDTTKINQAVPGKRACQKCGVSLKGRRYVKRDGIVLCEADWKEMFLPKCRRCTLPIETSAISSSDGQLKGKWHRECFTCHECDQPFSGESFYVFGDKPYCQLHYHRLNGTLCAASSCQLPIEGPCLLTSGNTRYHPGHLHCDHRDRNGNFSCRNPMEDYYEVATMKVCERHKDEALRVMNRMAGKRDAAGRMSVAAKAEKRRTRLIQM